MRKLSLLAILLPLAAAACTMCSGPTYKARENAPNIKWCPGSPGCLSDEESPIQAGAARRSVIPRGFEIPNPRYMNTTGCDPLLLSRFGVDRCGEIPDERPGNCGRDGICPGDSNYVAPDTDGSENDAAGKKDYFFDCGLDRICPPGAVATPENTPEPLALRDNGVDDDGDGAIDDGPWVMADEGEGDGIFQAAWIAGFGTNRAALGVIDDLDVRCLALRTAETTAVYCSLDAVGLFYDEVLRARSLLKERFPESEIDYLAVASSHTHENVDTMGQWGRAEPIPLTPGRLEGHNAFIVDQIVEAAAEAAANLRPARLTLATAQTGADGLIRDSRDPQVMDDTMTVVEARSVPAGEPIFTTIHWANHPEVLGGDNNLLSADYPAYLRRRVEGGFPEDNPPVPGRGGLAIYINGTVGGLMTPLGVSFTGRDGTLYPGPANVARTVAYGENLAVTALAALEDRTNHVTVERGVLNIKAETFRIPIQNRVFIFAFVAGLFDRAVYDDLSGGQLDPEFDDLLDPNIQAAAQTEVFTLDLGPLSLLGVPGELFPELAVGGYDGSKAFGRELVRANFCASQNTCMASQGDCPTVRPVGGWPDCACEQCRLCAPTPLENAPAGPYFKDLMPGRFKMVVGLANDEIGYLVPAYDWKVSEVAPYFCEARRHYEETNSGGEQAVPRLEAALYKLVGFEL